ncbi:T9SS type A sorting domain-containing protein [Fulvivirgaceae bacterium BMA10]|uniref:T9SS type A sorting domain-containing protein n=1 Tax=Splendidivirga corallicola TaxID=3051826 RepID=A0ABT8KWF7_9BACT|nr:T9SS type A sorting domain-containing protein [Fulvivirgaceae bacterium BMA10]
MKKLPKHIKLKEVLKLLIIYTLLVLSSGVQAQWVETIGKNPGLISGNSVVADNNGNAYVVGRDFAQQDQFTGTESDTVNSFERRRLFIHKYDREGNLLWENSIATDSVRANITDIGIDNNGNSYVTGYFQDSLKFSETVKFRNLNESALFIAKYDADGAFVWADVVAVTGSNTILPFSIAVDGSGNSFVGGAFNGTINFGSQIITSINNEFFIAKYNDDGNFQWAEAGITNSTTDEAYITDLAFHNNAIYALGNFNAQVAFTDTTLASNNDKANLFVAKYLNTPTPTLDMIIKAEAEEGNGLQVDNGNIFIAGKYTGNASFIDPDTTATIAMGGGSSAAFLSKYDQSGNFIWVKNGTVNQGDAMAESVDIDENGNAYITGSFGSNNTTSSLDFDGTATSSVDSLDIFMAKFNDAGNLIWLQSAGDIGHDESPDIAVSDSIDIFITGYYTESLKIGNIIASANFSGLKGFIANIDICPAMIAEINAADTITFCEGETFLLQATIDPNYSYQWQKDEEDIAGEIASSITVADSGVYRVEVTDTNIQCTKLSNEIVVIAYPVPQPELTLEGEPIICEGDSIKITTNLSSDHHFQWYRNGVMTSAADTLKSLVVYDPGIYHVEATNPFDCSAISDTQEIQVLPFPSNVITVEGELTFCEGNSVNLTAEHMNGFSYQWFRNNEALPNDTLQTLSATMSGQYFVQITNASICTIDSEINVISAVPIPEALAEAGSETSFCEGGGVTLFANQGVNLTYEWTKDGNIILDTNKDRLIVRESGSYQVIVTNDTDCSNTSDAIDVNVFTKPEATIQVNGATTFCKGVSTTLTANTGNGFSYQWKVYGTPIEGADARELEVTETGIYTVEVTDNNGCTRESSAETIEVKPLPDAFIVPLGPTTFCDGGVVTLQANSGNNFSYQWYQNDQVISGATSQNYEATGAGNYAVAITNGFDCSFLSEAIMVEVNTLPNTEVLHDTPLEFCEQDSVILYVNNEEGISYQWLKNGFEIEGAEKASLVVKEPGDYSLAALSTAFCSSVSNTFTVQVIDNDTPIINVNGNKLTTSLFISYQWNFNGTPIGGATNQIYEFDRNGNYSVTVTNDLGCGSTSESIHLCFPAATLTGNGDVLTASEGSAYQWYLNGEAIEGADEQKYAVLEAGHYSVKVTNADGCESFSAVIKRCFPNPTIAVSPESILVSTVGIAYQWYLDDEPISGATSQTLQADVNGSYRVEVLSYEECQALSDPVRVLVTSIDDGNIEHDLDYKIYPNPVKDYVKIKFTNNSSQTLTIQLTDVLGRTVHTNRYDQYEFDEEIDMGSLNEGVYLMHFVLEDKRVTERILKGK